MITEAQREESAAKRIEILREGFGDSNEEVRRWDETHPREETNEAGSADRLTTEEVEMAVETVPAPGTAEKPAKKKSE